MKYVTCIVSFLIGAVCGMSFRVIEMVICIVNYFAPMD